MARLIYSVIASLDGYIEDARGDFGWAAPDEEVHAYVNELERPIGTYLYGRRMYETMVVWETPHTFVGESPAMRDFALIWQAADKVVYSSTLTGASSARTRIERSFEAQSIRDLKASAGADISVGGAQLAAAALTAGLVDECQLLIAPIVVGAGRHWLPRDLRVKLELLDERRFAGGFVALHYRVAE